MKRILITLSYDGTAYAGWQRQKNAVSVQQTVEEAIHKVTAQFSAVTGASRTDAGVHAMGQAAHFDTISTIPPEKFPFALNPLLPPDIRVLSGCEAPVDFHARFCAQAKRYLYHIHNAPHASAIHRRTEMHVPIPLHIEPMRKAASALIGVHDFSAFCASGGSYKTPVREIYSIRIARNNAHIILSVYGNAFLYRMVRIITGTLIAVGQAKLPVSCFEHALQTGNRLLLGATAPAHGLCLEQVEYDPSFIQTEPDTSEHTRPYG